ncbi:substrate-binding domain-containing protein [Actinomadura madurae]|uniref:substrate-binding domain-containing protein n=2 Tax=Actinomadura madurae TaxID=1993 RepID=UPI0020262903|nr:substrate-binding domain-containing protein [Actinomadura madurae]URM93529.1 substrate-binding domain-containing protein [Actinomadura madurae]URN04248.1 substrate-binding domain-containing protein [Actinomadura madurae]
MSGHDDVPDWAPRNLPEPDDPETPYTFLGASQPGGAPAPHGPGARPAGPEAPFDAFTRPARASRPPGPAHAAAKPPRGRWLPGRGRPPRRVGGILLGPLAGAVGLVLLTGLGAYAVAAAGDGCSGDDALTLTVAAAPDIAPAVIRAAGRLNDAKDEVDGRCVRARVRATEPAAVATLLSGKGVAGVTERPDVWIPDSSLWTKLVGSSDRPGAAGSFTDLGGMASSPIVLAMPRGLATQLRNLGAPEQPSWKELLAAAGASDGGQDPDAGDGVIPARLFRLQVPDPDRSATGMGSLMLAGALLAGSPGGQARFAGVVRTIREGIAASVAAEFAAFGKGDTDRYPVALAPEQAVFSYNARRPAEQAVAVYPAEGTIFLDHPVTVLSGDGAKAGAARLLGRALSARATRDDVQRLGFRTPGGAAPAAFSPRTGLNPRAPKALPPAPAADVRRTMQSWAQLSLSIRMLSIIDVSGSMDRKLAPGVTRLQATVRTAQSGLSLLPDDSELGQWVFSTKLEGGQDWRELVSVGPLGERLGSATRRQQMLSAFAQIRVKKRGDTGLYETVMAAFDYMKRTYKPEYVNSVLLWTDGRNEDPGGPSLAETLDHIRREYDPERPVLINMFGNGDDVDVNELRQIARLTRGDAYVAETPEEVQTLFLKALSQRVNP